MTWKTEVAIMAMLMTALGTFANIANKLLNKEPVKPVTFLCQVVVSGFAGCLVWLLTMSFGADDYLVGALSGLAGWSGASIIRTTESVVVFYVDSLKKKIK